MPDAMWGIASGLFSGVLASLVARVISVPERRENTMLRSYEALMKRNQQLEEECSRCHEAYAELERRHIRALRDNGRDGEWRDK